MFARNNNDLRRKDFSNREKIMDKNYNIEKHTTKSSKEINKATFAKSNLSGHVSVAKPKGKFDSMDMTVHLTLKANEKGRGRSHSLSRSDKKTECKQAIDNSKRWNEILANNDVPPLRKITHSHRRSRSVSPERDTPDFGTSRSTNREEARVSRNAGSSEDVSAISCFHPVRTLQFLVYELKSTVKDERVQGIFNLMEQILRKLPQTSPVNASVAKGQTESTTPRSVVQFSRTAFETMRKERDSMEKQLSDKVKSHIALERKLATLEAKLVRVKSEKDEVQKASQTLLSEHHSLLTAVKEKQMNFGDSHVVSQLKEELNTANTYINQLQKGVALLEMKYKSKMMEVQGILHGGFDISKNDTALINDVLGEAPDNGKSPAHQFEVHQGEPLTRPKTPEPPQLQMPKDVGELKSQIEIEKFMNELMQKNNLEDDFFQSFLSIPDLPADKVRFTQ